MGEREYGMDLQTIDAIAAEIVDVHASGVEIAIVVGGGNIYRGMAAAAEGWTARPRTTRACSPRCSTGSRSRTRSSVPARTRACSRRSRSRRSRSRTSGAARSAPRETGSCSSPRDRQPVLHDDTAAALRSLEIGAQAILMSKHGVEGVYDGDPNTEPDVTLLPALTHLEAIERGLKVMDTTALSLCMDNDIRSTSSSRSRETSARRHGERVGTIISIKEGAEWQRLRSSSRTRAAHGQVGRARRNEFSTVRTGRASAALLDRITSTTTARRRR
jgi:uridylate kinase